MHERLPDLRPACNLGCELFQFAGRENAVVRNEPAERLESGDEERLDTHRHRFHATDGSCAVAPAAGQDVVVHRILNNDYVLDDDPDRIDREAVHAFISQSYWAAGRERAVMDELIATAARVVGLYAPDGRQLGFARVVSDGHTVSYLADVYVLEEARGRGFGLELVRFTVDGGTLGHTKWQLHTRDMHSLYAKLGFVAPGRAGDGAGEGLRRCRAWVRPTARRAGRAHARARGRSRSAPAPASRARES